MLRLGAIFIVVCMVLIAGAAGAVLYLAFGLSGPEATVVAVTVLTALALYNAVTARLRDRSDFGGQIADLSRGTADLAHQVAEIGRRITALEGRGDDAAEAARTATAPLSAELSELGTLVKELAETVAVHDAALAAVKDTSTPGKPPEGSDETAESATAGGLGGPETGSAAVAATPDAGVTREQTMAAIRSAVEANRIDLHLQPVVTLPQRKVRFYEALSRLRTEDGHMLPPAEFLEPAEAGGLLSRIDHLLLFRCVQVLRRLLLKNRDIGLFCNVASSTLNDPQFFPQMAQFMEANRALAPSLVLEFRQSAWRAMGAREQESLVGLRQLGFRFCMDQVADLRIEPRDLADRGVRFVKAPAPLLLGRAGTPSAESHIAELSDQLNRHGITLIADQIESESQVVELLDHDLRFGQGMLFSPPRPVRAEALQGIVERPDAPPATPPGADPRAAAL